MFLRSKASKFMPDVEFLIAHGFPVTSLLTVSSEFLKLKREKKQQDHTATDTNKAK